MALGPFDCHCGPMQSNFPAIWFTASTAFWHIQGRYGRELSRPHRSTYTGIIDCMCWANWSLPFIQLVSQPASQSNARISGCGKSILENHFLHQCARKQIPTSLLFARRRRLCRVYCWSTRLEWQLLLRVYHTKSIPFTAFAIHPINARWCFNAIRHFMQISNILLSCSSPQRQRRRRSGTKSYFNYSSRHPNKIVCLLRWVSN